ncbi:hypothetical protein SAMN04488691_11089 [Haloferax larsenii]|uniref:Uncharacterized protein n=1 Tax=Haloferax larsenii TaxID=302484 RepID=A0A1H7TWV4_HALLR|nr:hypothetical protein SAMN04488691_11089 [Haloferax larsenii]
MVQRYPAEYLPDGFLAHIFKCSGDVSRQIGRNCPVVYDLRCLFDTGTTRLDVPEPESKKPIRSYSR